MSLQLDDTGPLTPNPRRSESGTTNPPLQSRPETFRARPNLDSRVSSPIVLQAVFLDRDNTLIANDGDLGDPQEVRLLDGVAEGLKSLREAGYRLIIVTNQGGVARGVFTEDDVDSVHQRIAALVDETAETEQVIDRFYYCPYHPDATIEDYRRDHPWRKPHPGMLLQAAKDMDLDLSRCWMIGDQGRDIEAGRAAGCRTVLITENGLLTDSARPTCSASGFQEAVRTVLDSEDLPDTEDEPEAQWDEPESEDSTEDEAGSATITESRAPEPIAGSDDLKRAINHLTEEIRSERLRRAEFTGFRLAAGLCQLLVLLLALLGLLQLGTTDAFMKWMIGAALVQLLTITIVLLDLKG